MLQVGAPCSESWDGMRADGAEVRGARFCDACGKSVHDLTGVTERRALAMFAVFGSGGLCGRLRVGPDGAAVFAPVPPPRQAPRHLPMAMFAAVTAAAMTACSPASTMPSASPGGGALGLAGGRAGDAAATSELASPGPSAAVSSPSPPPAHVDSDGDSIPDDVDACPGQAGPQSPDPGKNGCHVGVVVGQSDVVIRPVIDFAFGSKIPAAESTTLLEEIAKVLADHPEIRAIELTGHSSPDEGNGKALSLARAEAVRAILIKLGISADRLITLGAASDSPRAPNTTNDNRAKNRRLELRVVPRKEAGSST